MPAKRHSNSGPPKNRTTNVEGEIDWTFEVIFQGKGQSGMTQICEPDKVLLNPSDMKVIGIKIGSFVVIRGGSTSLLVQAHSSTTVLSKNICIHKMWKFNFNLESPRFATVLKDVTQCIIQDSISCTLLVAGISVEIANTEFFAAYLISAFTAVPITIGHHLSITWKGKPVQVRVTSIIFKNAVNNSTISHKQQNISQEEKVVMVFDGTNMNRKQFTILKPETILQFIDEIPNEDPLFIPPHTAHISTNNINSVSHNTVISVPTTALTTSPLFSSSEMNQINYQPLSYNTTTNSNTNSLFGGYFSQQRECMQLIQKFRSDYYSSKMGFAQSHTAICADSGRQALLEKLFRPPKGLLLYGPSGTGKTSLMKLLAAESNCAIEEIPPDILLKRFEGEAESELQRTFRNASRRAPCLLLVNDLHLICRPRSSANSSDLQKRLVSCMLSLLDGAQGDCQDGGEGSTNGVFLIATTSRPDAIEPAMRRPGRLDLEVELPVPTAEDREAILRVLLMSMDVNITDDVCDGNNDLELGVTHEGVRSVASGAHGMVGADLLLVCKHAHLSALRRVELTDMGFENDRNSSTTVTALEDRMAGLSLTPTAAMDKIDTAPGECYENHSMRRIKLTNGDLVLACRHVRPSALREAIIEVPSVHWSDIGGMETVKQQLREVVEWPILYSSLFASMGITPPRGVLLFGPPGCSKTLLAKALATESKRNFLAVRGPELLSKWLGESEKAIQTLFRRARGAAPSLIFFDEIDALAGKRGSGAGGVSDRVLAQLLTEMDGGLGASGVVVVAATNRPDMLDDALLRPGRFDRKIYIPPPDAESRKSILLLQLRRFPVATDVTAEALTSLVSATEGFSGAEVVAVCSEASMKAAEEESTVSVELRHLLDAISHTKPQITPSMITFYSDIASKYKF